LIEKVILSIYRRLAAATTVL